jgi:thymidylate synthase
MTIFSPEQQYLDACVEIIHNGTWVYNKRTGKRVKTIINLDMEYDCSENKLPMLTTKKMAWKSAIAEMLGYLKGYNNAADFRELGTKTWDANANAKVWQESHYCNGPDDMGYCYGAVGSKFRLPTFDYQVIGEPVKFATFNQWEPVVRDLCNGIDNRREIITFYHPGTTHMACLPPCVHTHTFSLLDGTLYLTSYQRSADMPLGVPFNMIQLGWLLMVMARLTGNNPGSVFHKIVNAHIYEDQIELMKTQLARTPLPPPTLMQHPIVSTFDDLVKFADLRHFEVDNYQCRGSIAYPFSV